VAEVLDRDLELYQDRCRGMQKVALAKKYGLDRGTVVAIIERVKATMPATDRAEVFDQSVEILDAGLAVFAPMMMDGDKAAGRLVDRLIGRRNEMLGLDSPAKLELYQNQHQPQQVNIREELAVLLAKIREEQQHGR
jgi:hypothetical protein